MKDKIKQIKQNLQNDPRFQEQIQKMKPKRSIWGFWGVILIFFVPEILNHYYYKEINEWIYNYAQNAPNIQMRDALIWLSHKTFDGQLSYINISLGIIFLVWLFRK